MNKFEAGQEIKSATGTLYKVTVPVLEKRWKEEPEQLLAVKWIKSKGKWSAVEHCLSIDLCKAA